MTPSRQPEPPRTRATSDSAKAIRRAALLTAAGHLFSSREFDAVFIVDMARGAGIAKGTFYLYFKNKEAIFLELYMQKLREWFDELEARFPRAGSAPAALASVIASTFGAKPELLRLTALLHTVLEERVDSKEFGIFKMQMAGMMRSLARNLESILNLQEGQGVRVMQWIHALMVGLTQMVPAKPGHIHALSAEPQLRPFLIDFQTEFESALASLLAGVWRVAHI